MNLGDSTGSRDDACGLASARGRGIAAALPAALVVVALLWAGAAPGRAQVFDDIAVTDATAFAGSSMHGYAELRFFVTNRSIARAHTVTLALRGENEGRDQLARVSRTVEVAPGSTVTVTLLQPPLALSLRDVELSIDGRPREGLNYTGVDHEGVAANHWRGHTDPTVLVGRPVEPAFRAFVEAQRPTGPGGFSVSTNPSFNLVTPNDAPDRWPTHFLAYTRFAGVVLSAGEMSELPEPVADALLRYVELGGVLLVVGDYTPPPHVAPDAGPAPLEGRLHHVGFGALIVTPRSVAQLPPPTDPVWTLWHTHFVHTHNTLLLAQDLESANQRLPIVAALQVPVRAMLALMIAFAVVIGPVNYFVLARKRRQVWLLWTVPTIALLTSAAVFVYATAAEGWRARARSDCLVHLDQRTQRATTLGWLAYYAPLTPSQGLRFDDLTELTPQLGYSHDGRGGTARTVDWTSGQHLSSGWITARTPAFFRLRKSQRRLERITVTTEPGSNAPRVTNGLGATIQSLTLIDNRSACYTADRPIAPGESVTLTTRSAPQTATNLRGFFGGVWDLGALNNAPAPLAWQPNTYQATLDRNPFLEEGLPNLGSNQQQTVVYGVLDTPVILNTTYP